jgi:2-oxoacid:acceptor oxidoreductase delta subunit (pyruvate/2-ketoisovalerate family)
LGRASALSAGLAAAAARLSGLIVEEVLVRAMREEFDQLGVTDADVEQNLQIARLVFSKLPSLVFAPAGIEQTEPLVAMTYDDPLRGAPSVLAPGNAALRQTGGWRVERPVIDPTVCTRCGLCFVQCPDGAIALDEHGYPVIDYDHCKGCMICRQVCPLEAITSTKETRAW